MALRGEIKFKNPQSLVLPLLVIYSTPKVHPKRGARKVVLINIGEYTIRKVIKSWGITNNLC